MFDGENKDKDIDNVENLNDSKLHSIELSFKNSLLNDEEKMKPSFLKQVQAHSISDNSARNLFDGKNKKVYTQPLFIEIRISIELNSTYI